MQQTTQTLTIDIIERGARSDTAYCFFEGIYDSEPKIPAKWYYVTIPKGEFDSRDNSRIVCMWLPKKRSFLYVEPASTAQ